MEFSRIRYTRNFTNTAWQSLYVPFEIPVDLLNDKFEIAYINGVLRADKNQNGVLEGDEFRMELILIHGGGEQKNNVDGSGRTLRANYPYFIRSKEDSGAKMDITLEEVTLLPAEDRTYECTTMTEEYVITGNTAKKLKDTFAENQYTVGKSGWTQPKSALLPFRFYLTINSREGSEVLVPMTTMSIVVRGEQNENGETIIYDVVEDSQAVDFIYDLQGRRVLEPQKGGIYIVNGKKIVF